MRFTIDQRYDADADAIARAYANPDLYADLPATAKLGPPEVVSHQQDGDRAVLEVRYRFQGDLSSAVRAVLDPARLTWVERTEHDLVNRTIAFTLRPDNYADRMRCSGQLRIEPVDGGGSRRTGEGDLKVRAPLVAGTVERTLVADLQDHLRADAQVVAAWVRG